MVEVAAAFNARAWSYWAWTGQLARPCSGELQVKQSLSATAFTLRASRATLRAAALLFADKSMGAGPFQAGFEVVL